MENAHEFPTSLGQETRNPFPEPTKAKGCSSIQYLTQHTVPTQMQSHQKRRHGFSSYLLTAFTELCFLQNEKNKSALSMMFPEKDLSASCYRLRLGKEGFQGSSKEQRKLIPLYALDKIFDKEFLFCSVILSEWDIL